MSTGAAADRAVPQTVRVGAFSVLPGAAEFRAAMARGVAVQQVPAREQPRANVHGRAERPRERAGRCGRANHAAAAARPPAHAAVHPDVGVRAPRPQGVLHLRQPHRSLLRSKVRQMSITETQLVYEEYNK